MKRKKDDMNRIEKVVKALNRKYERGVAALKRKIERRIAQGLDVGEEVRFGFNGTFNRCRTVKAIREEYGRRGFKVVWKGHRDARDFSWYLRPGEHLVLRKL